MSTARCLWCLSRRRQFRSPELQMASTSFFRGHKFLADVQFHTTHSLIYTSHLKYLLIHCILTAPFHTFKAMAPFFLISYFFWHSARSWPCAIKPPVIIRICQSRRPTDLLTCGIALSVVLYLSLDWRAQSIYKVNTSVPFFWQLKACADEAVTHAFREMRKI